MPIGTTRPACAAGCSRRTTEQPRWSQIARRSSEWGFPCCSWRQLCSRLRAPFPFEIGGLANPRIGPCRWCAVDRTSIGRSRVWIDTDAACNGGNADPDDCFAMLVLMHSPDVEIVGISTVFGNAPLSVVDRTTRDLVGRIAGSSDILVHSGSSTALKAERTTSIEPAHSALERALERGPLTIVSLGPLTNVAATLRRRPDLADNIGLLVAVMGRRPGHVFHPAEGRNSSGILFGHGPIFRDFNFSKDRTSASIVLGLAERISLTPYAAAREVMVTRRDLARMRERSSRGGMARRKGWTLARLLGGRHRPAGILPVRCPRSALRPPPAAIQLREGPRLDRRGRSAARAVAHCAWLDRIARRFGIRSTADHARSPVLSPIAAEWATVSRTC